jgi:hypothetical protein
MPPRRASTKAIKRQIVDDSDSDEVSEKNFSDGNFSDNAPPTPEPKLKASKSAKKVVGRGSLPHLPPSSLGVEHESR